MADHKERFIDLLERASAELYADNRELMDRGDLRPTGNVIHPDDARLFWEGVDAGLIDIKRAGRFNTLDRPTPTGRWGLLSRSHDGGW